MPEASDILRRDTVPPTALPATTAMLLAALSTLDEATCPRQPRTTGLAVEIVGQLGHAF